MFLNFLGMLAGLIIALSHIFDPRFDGFMRWVMVTCGLLIFIYHLSIALDKKKNRVVNQNEEKN
ncbi:hypothetical protein CHN50_15065 [Priestia aryabhattai]|uniref:hypothetical protein n=1 Tax=Bacillaceae TaxID=186817 RepID=UPI000B9FB718|nr:MULTISPECIES: hypothetical protein [Bacillaceae]MDT2047897.1 hypothetical protein [Priestia flexa]OZT11794.1 hypothetical protein CHN50_15065 [Priestia aryabhattai]TDB52367.1 hypothetical protein EPL02_07955 [Bacillus sp. CBEL-1]USY56015.1 hypothetical protein NIZ91_04990 [Bacillus sp. 1780r2a1]